MIIILFADNIEAVRNLWLLGDDFLREMYYSLRAMKQTEHTGNKCREQRWELYIHRQYNMKEFDRTKDFARDNILARMVNASIQAVNKNPILPRLLIIIPNDGIIKLFKHTGFGFGISMMLGKCIHWFINQLEKTISIRKDALATRKPYGSKQSSFLVIMMICVMFRAGSCHGSWWFMSWFVVICSDL